MAVKTFTQGEVATAADTNTYLANGGLVYVATGSNTSTTGNTISNCFSSTYDHYRIVGTLSYSSASAVSIYMRFRTTSDDTAADYKWGRTYIRFDGVFGSTGTLTDNTAWAGEVGNNGKGLFVVDIFNPNIATQTYWTTQWYPTIQSATNNSYIGGASGFKDTTVQYTGLTLYTSGGGNFTSTFTVYGYRKA